MTRSIVMRTCGVVAGAVILGVSSVAEADFVIYLRDGKEIVVDQYREDGDQIRYSRFGGQIGIPKAHVAVIEDRKTGEKRVFNQPYTAQEVESFRKGQESRLQDAQRRQELSLRKGIIIWKSREHMILGADRMKKGQPFREFVACELIHPAERVQIVQTYHSHMLVKVVAGPSEGCVGVANEWSLPDWSSK